MHFHLPYFTTCVSPCVRMDFFFFKEKSPASYFSFIFLKKALCLKPWPCGVCSLFAIQVINSVVTSLGMCSFFHFKFLFIGSDG